MPCRNVLAALAFGITRESFAIKLAQSLQHTRRTPGSVLIEIEPQPYAIAQRWMKGLQRTD